MAFPESSLPWQPTPSLPSLAARSRLLRKVREFFHKRDFLEVQTPCLSRETVVDAHLEPIEVRLRNPDAVGETTRFYLQTSPEAAMKRMLAAGARAIYQIGPVFRNDELGQHHNLEFTMLEWYRVGDDLDAGVSLLGDLVSDCLAQADIRRLTYRQLFRDQLGIDPIEASDHALAAELKKHEVGIEMVGDATAAMTRDECLDAIMGLVIQPRLRGVSIVSNYPLSQAALARRSDEDPATAERFELFIEGVEIANGYAELLDSDELRRRTDENNAARERLGRPPLPPPERLIAAMRCGMPPASGTALGFDRLLMAVTGSQRIDQVIAFPIDRA
jgi:lysyl-tRNA synthetase class 2